ncbi:MAG: NifB/NifX family molybdenum-iron cluster-binding protein [Nanobdellota archaeon]
MRLVITTNGEQVEQRFGRCKEFLVVDGESRETIENEGALEAHGAGIKAAQQIANLRPTAVITGEVGPKAADVLRRMGLKAYHAHGLIDDAINEYKNRNLELMVDPGLICVPLLDTNGRESQISEHFGHAPYLGIYNPNSDTLTIEENILDHQIPKSPVEQLMEWINPSMIFAIGMGARAIQLFTAYGVNLKTGPYKTVKEMIQHQSAFEDLTRTCKEE